MPDIVHFLEDRIALLGSYCFLSLALPFLFELIQQLICISFMRQNLLDFLLDVNKQEFYPFNLFLLQVSLHFHVVSFLLHDVQLIACLFFLVIGPAEQLSFYQVKMDLLVLKLSLFLDCRVSL